MLHGELTVPRHYIYCTRNPPDDRFRPFLERSRQEGWGVFELNSSHNPHINAPDELTGIFDEIAKATGLTQAGAAV